MAFFGLFGKKSSDSVLKKHAARVADKRAQAPDRWESIQALGAMRTAGAVEALLPRFTYYTDPSITDQDEKDEVFRVIVETGEAAIDPVVASMGQFDSLGWPLRILDRLASPDRVVAELLALLERMDTEYQRDPSRKIGVLQALEERRDPRIVAGATRFLEDVNAATRFQAAAAIVAQDSFDEARAAMTKAMAAEDSLRVTGKLLEGFAARGWDLGEARTAVERTLPAGFVVDKAGVPHRR